LRKWEVSEGVLIVSVDRSVSRRFKFYGVVGMETGAKRKLLEMCSWVKHVRELSRMRRVQYLATFRRRYNKVLPYLAISRVYESFREVNLLIDSLNPYLTIVDDALYPNLKVERKVREGRVKEKSLKTLTLLADNLAYYARHVRESKPKEYQAIIMELWR